MFRSHIVDPAETLQTPTRCTPNNSSWYVTKVLGVPYFYKSDDFLIHDTFQNMQEISKDSLLLSFFVLVQIYVAAVQNQSLAGFYS